MAPNTQRSMSNLQSLGSETTMVPVRDTDDVSAPVSRMPRNLSRTTLAELAKREQADNCISVTKQNQLRVRL
jgi:hypothetical protein